MGLTKKKHYGSYTLAYKINAVKLSKKKDVKATDVAEALVFVSKAGCDPAIVHQALMGGLLPRRYLRFMVRE